MQSDLGIFPLHIVLFPQAIYPLHIFEDRYKQLVADVDESGLPFGINLVDGGKMYDVGCSVRIARVSKAYEDGRKDIVVEGIERYRIVGESSESRPYLVSRVAPFGDIPEERDISVMTDTIRLFNELVDAVYGTVTLPLDPDDWMVGTPSFRIAQKSGLDLVRRQKILEMQSENERLSYLQRHLTRILPKIRRIDQIRKLSRNDGYLPGSGKG